MGFGDPFSGGGAVVVEKRDKEWQIDGPRANERAGLRGREV
jgi:hypothetical protein